jgi:hypothetical protein
MRLVLFILFVLQLLHHRLHFLGFSVAKQEVIPQYQSLLLLLGEVLLHLPQVQQLRRGFELKSNGLLKVHPELFEFPGVLGA